MKLLVISGSPRGIYSVTLQTILYLQKIYKEHSFEIIHAGSTIKALEKDMSKALEKINEADAIIFAYPVYTFLAPSQLHRFIELLKEANIDLSNKFVTQITTSKHFYDYTAHKYIEENCYDLNMKYVKGLSLDMDDLLKEKGQKDAINFFNYFLNCINTNTYEDKPIRSKNEIKPYIPSIENSTKDESKEAVMVVDLKENDTNLSNMIEDFKRAFKYKISIVNLNDFNFHGGCLGCFNCAGSGKCIYKDNFDTFLRENIQSKDAIILAFNIKDHSMGVRFKMYDDRQFCNGHRTVTEGMPFAYIINGDLENEANLKTVIEARGEVGHNFISGIATNKKTIIDTANRLAYSIENKYVQPRNCLGVGGMKIFRDLIWVMRGIMKEDHKFYKKNKVYDDLPQKSRGKMILFCFLGSMTRNKRLKKKMGNKFNEYMVMPYQKVIKKLDKNEKS